MHTSQMRFYSLGIVTTNKALNSHEVEVTPIELVNMLDGELTSNPTGILDEGVDGSGKKYSVEVTADNSVTAKWFPFGSTNRRTPPDLRRGERVLLWQFADADVFYWTSTGWDDHLRRLETVIWAISNTTDESTKKIDPTNSYYLEASTHDKHITLYTSKNDGEPFAYTFQFNTRDGVVTLADDGDNYIEFNSAETAITMKNADDTLVQLDRQTINAFSKKDINVETKTLNVEAKDINVTAVNMATTAKLSEWTIETTNWTGAFNLTGPFTLAGPFAMGPGPGGAATAEFTGNTTITGDVTFNGNFVMNGSGNCTGTFTANKIVSSTALSAPNV